MQQPSVVEAKHFPVNGLAMSKIAICIERISWSVNSS
jgi:hypothetical protein